MEKETYARHSYLSGCGKQNLSGCGGSPIFEIFGLLASDVRIVLSELLFTRVRMILETAGLSSCKVRKQQLATYTWCSSEGRRICKYASFTFIIIIIIAPTPTYGAIFIEVTITGQLRDPLIIFFSSHLSDVSITNLHHTGGRAPFAPFLVVDQIVTSISASAFERNHNLLVIKLHNFDFVDTIETRAFCLCSFLSRMMMLGVKKLTTWLSIGFGLSNVEFGRDFGNYGESAFDQCSY
eukprot:scaffold30514_cov154-Skeletonema_dohrnii-CCMP3373.AAC.1